MGSKKVIDWRKRTKLRMIESMGDMCCICGYNKCSNALEFHHLDPEEKEFSFGSARANIKSWGKLVIELRKCILVCSNCHREIHDNKTHIPNDVRRFDETFTDYKSLDNCDKHETNVKYNRKFVGYNDCPICGKSKKENQNYCSTECSSVGTRKVSRPSKDELEILIKENSWLALGKMFSVSDNAVRKWARQYGII